VGKIEQAYTKEKTHGQNMNTKMFVNTRDKCSK